MSALVLAALLTVAASLVATGCVAYVLFSFRRSGHLMASRVGRQPLALVLLAAERSRGRRNPKDRSVAGRTRLLQPVAAS